MAVRTLTAWCPDWPLAAAGIAPDVPAAVLSGEEVLACTAAARADGVRRGLRRREAQRRSPGIRLLPRDGDAEARAFEPVVASLDSICPRVEVVRPGTVVFATKGPSRYFGGDVSLAGLVAGQLDDAVTGLPGVVRAAPCQVGVADGLFASRLAARQGTVVPLGGSAAFLAPFPVAALDRPELADLLVRLGLRTLGAFAGLPASRVASRFGADGLLAHRLARGLDERPLAAREIPPDLAVESEVDPPADQVEPLAFLAKTLADTLRDELEHRGLVCTRVLVEAETEHGETRGRLWRHDGALTANAVAQRVRWQLAGWLAGPAGDRPTAGITRLRLVPDEVHLDTGQQLPLWGGATDADERAADALARLQGLLGFDAVRVAVPAGGRAPDETVRLVPWGEPKGTVFDGTPPWPGRLPAPSPSLVYTDPLPSSVWDRAGAVVTVDDRGELSAPPARVEVHKAGRAGVVDWAGPWPVDERWWDAGAARTSARVQVVTDDGAARLFARAYGGWWVEAAYD
ncbi:MAG TPA: DNA polymerase Y family protein [Mycobacteriales bacterium]|jgi:protein ImuB|nr:DNA polymerase Y family protein [Mycobacteriales bacterium]